MQMDLARTIVALSSGLAPAKRAIVRISGAESAHVLSRLLQDRPDGKNAVQGLLRSNRASHCKANAAIRSRHRASTTEACSTDRLIPVDIYYWPNHRSFTGEPCAEIHLPGAMPLVESLIESIVSLGASTANRGEFTLRSFLAGKLDLPQAEAVLGVIEADSTTELEFALGQLAGNLSQPVRDLRTELLELTAHLEAGLDFVEEDIEFISSSALLTQLQSIHQRLIDIVNRLVSRGTRARATEVVLTGLPNAGKSSLFNALVGSNRVIVSDQAGTTRDAITCPIEFHGTLINLVDTAGFEFSEENSPRQAAQQTLIRRLKEADIIVLCQDLSTQSPQFMDEAERFCRQIESLDHSSLVRVGTKDDLPPHSPYPAVDVQVSIHDASESIEKLKIHLEQLVASRSTNRHSGAMHEAMIRSREAIGRAGKSVARAIESVRENLGEEITAAELRLALHELAAVIGEVHTEDILGEIFGRFCIGK